MRRINKIDFINKSTLTIEKIFDKVMEQATIKLQDLPAQNTGFVMIDMVNGFTREGALKSSRIEAIIPELATLSRKCDDLGIVKIAFADQHSKSSPEFEAYPEHCLLGTNEIEIVEEIKAVAGYQLIYKNSTNGFLEEEFQQWLSDHDQIDHFIITGDCTDICIQQFAITLKTWFNKQDKKSRIIVPIHVVDTYDLDIHNGDLMQVMALYNMMGNGIEIVNYIES
ncbi:MAG: cysteine hydrolase [Firmicutes bacterium HGW-Firmicutes-1]|jgi:nicotinamidase-related amidase|nr:MAG: cysteine hydrolase [Firmicutes bacterium HGW-Firmicutes-1]